MNSPGSIEEDCVLDLLHALIDGRACDFCLRLKATTADDAICDDDDELYCWEPAACQGNAPDLQLLLLVKNYLNLDGKSAERMESVRRRLEQQDVLELAFAVLIERRWLAPASPRA